MKSKRGNALVAFIIGLAIGAIAGAVAANRFADTRRQQAAQVERDERALAQPPARPAAPPAEAAREDYLQRKLREWNLTPEDLKKELARAGDVIQREGRELGNRLSEASGDVRIVAVIKAKYTLDKELSAWQVVVGCKDGHVTLSGAVSSADLIGRAIVIALETEGVVDVSSSLKVKAGTEPAH